MRVALLGGSFNPPHIGHQMVCLWALSSDRVDQVWLLPCYQHAFNKRLVAFKHRRAMCEAALEPLAPGRVEVCDVERELGAPSRTLNTVAHLKTAFPQHRFSLLIGADILGETDSWYRFEEIERMVEILVVGRDGYPVPPESVVMPAISSTEVRRLIRQGQPVSHLMPAAVERYVEAHRLYRGARDD